MLTFVTSNMHKFREAERVLKEYNIIIQHAVIQYPEIRAENLEDVAADSVERLKREVGPPFFLEDTGLFIKSLNGFPGPYTGWVLGKLGLSGILRLMEGNDERSAVFRTAIALFDGKETIVLSEEVHGKIATEKKGDGGFGYDPIFIPEGSEKTFAEMGAEEKNKVSHRGKVLRKLAKKIKYSK